MNYALNKYGSLPVEINRQPENLDRIMLLSRVSVAFGIIGITTAAIMLIMARAGMFGPPRLATFVSILLVMTTTLVVAGTSYIFARDNRYMLANRIFHYGLVGTLTLTMYLIGGTISPLFIAYLIPVMTPGLLGDMRDGISVFLASLGCYVVLTLLAHSGMIEPLIVFTGYAKHMLYVIAFAAIGGLLTYMSLLWSSGSARFTAQLQAQSEELLESNEQLLQKNIQHVRLGSELASAAQQLLATSHQQSLGATQQASDVIEVSTTIEELGATAHQIALAAEQVASATKQTLENISEGQDAVERSIQAMERIRIRVRDVSTRVLSLGERSQEIGEVIDLINDLSDETHLLALNAAIEAVGAGEHGRRFTVVAAEVKSLANRALTAAKEVKGVIAEVQQATNAAVSAAEEGGKEVEYGVELARSAGQVMDSIITVAERTAQSGSEISLATAQQQSASEQVVQTMREVANVARQAAAGARQMTESAQILTSIAEHLHGSGETTTGNLTNSHNATRLTRNGTPYPTP